MKKVPLKTEIIAIEGQDQAKLVYAEHMLNMLRQPKNPQAGVQADEMRVSLPIMEKIEAADKDFRLHVLLEDAEHKDLTERATAFRFAVAHPALLEMVDDIKNAETVDIREVAEG